MAEKISAQEFAEDIKAGMDDDSLMVKYDLTPDQLDAFKKQLRAKGLLDEPDPNTGPSGRGGQALPTSKSQQRRESKPLTGGPDSTRVIFRCPKCNTPQEEGRIQCSQCGVLFHKTGGSRSAPEYGPTPRARIDGEITQMTSTLKKVVAAAVGITLFFVLVGVYKGIRHVQEKRRFDEVMSQMRPHLESMKSFTVTDAMIDETDWAKVAVFRDVNELTAWMKQYGNLVMRKDAELWRKLNDLLFVAEQVAERRPELERASSMIVQAKAVQKSANVVEERIRDRRRGTVTVRTKGDVAAQAAGVAAEQTARDNMKIILDAFGETSKQLNAASARVLAAFSR